MAPNRAAGDRYILMEQQSKEKQAIRLVPSYFIVRALSLLRWGLIAMLLLLTILHPTSGRLGLPSWGWLLLLAVYNLAGDLFLRACPPSKWPRVLVIRSMLDLPVVGTIYLLSGHAGGPLFTLFFLATVCGATVLSLRATLVYTASSVALVALLEPGLLLPALENSGDRSLGARLVVLAFTGAGAAILKRGMALEQQTANAAREEALRLHELVGIREHFISSVSHELRTPLTATRAALALIEQEMSDQMLPNEQELLGNARRNLERLRIIIDDLLTFNQVEAGTLKLNRQQLDLRAMVTDTLSTVYPLILEKDQTLEIALPEPLPYNGDARQLEQVIVNLIANAHRHTPRGTRITVSGWITPSEVLLAVSDNGPGIPLPEQDAIFERFYRLRPEDQGSGLGLAIARAIVELHDGRLWVESNDDKHSTGSTFFIALFREQSARVGTESSQNNEDRDGLEASRC